MRLSASYFTLCATLYSMIASSVASNLTPADKQYPPVRLVVEPPIDGTNDIIVPLILMELNENHELQVDRFVVGGSSLDTRQEHTFRIVDGPSDAYAYGCGFISQKEKTYPTFSADRTITFELVPNVARTVGKVQRIYCMAIYTFDL